MTLEGCLLRTHNQGAIDAQETFTGLGEQMCSFNRGYICQQI